MKKLLVLAAVAGVMALGTSISRADSLVHTFFPGHGDPQDFVVTDTGGVELGLQAQVRGIGGPFTRVGDTYQASVPWNFDFSIDTNSGKGPASLLADYTAIIDVSFNGVQVGTYNPLFTVNDNEGDGITLAQNSENLSFNGLFSSPVGTGAPLNPNLPGTYTFTLNLTPVTGGAVISDTMNVVVAPLPSAAGMGAVALAMLGGAALLRKKLRLA